MILRLTLTILLIAAGLFAFWNAEFYLLQNTTCDKAKGSVGPCHVKMPDWMHL